MSDGLLTALASLMAILVSAGSLWVALRKAPAEKKNIEVDTAQKYQLIADQAAERTLKMGERIEELEKELAEVKAELATVQKILADKDEEIESLRDWAERLVNQARMAGLNPVPLYLKYQPNSRTHE